MDTILKTLEIEWHERNKKPFSAYGRTSHIKAWWKCSKCSFEWQATKGNRTSNGSGCPECRKEKARGNNNSLWNGYGEISGRHWHCIKLESHRRREVPLLFEITIEYAWKLFLEQNRKCVFTGVELTMWGKRNGKHTGTASLDRKDSSKGYIDGNVQWVEKRIQHVKRNWADKDFIALCEEVTMHQTKKKLGSLPSFEKWTQTHQ